MIKVTIWNEYVHEKQEGPAGDRIRAIYPNGIHALLKEKLACDGFNVVQNNGACASQSVPHVHFHVIPRWGTEPKATMWTPSPYASMDEMKAMHARLTQA